MGRKGIVLASVLVAMALAGVVAVGFFVYRNMNFRYTQQNQSVSIDNAVSESPNSDPDSWKGTKCSQAVGSSNQNGEYQNRQVGFSVKIPKNWKLIEYCHGAQVYQLTLEAPDSGEPISRDPKCLPCHSFVREFQVSVLDKEGVGDLESLKRFIEDNFGYNKDSTKISVITDGGTKGYEVTGLIGYGIKNYFMLGSGKVYTITQLEYVESANVDNPKYSSLFENFLASFRLI